MSTTTPTLTQILATWEEKAADLIGLREVNESAQDEADDQIAETIRDLIADIRRATTPPAGEGLPAIVFDSEAVAAWIDTLRCMTSWNVTVTLNDDSTVECQIAGLATADTDGYPVLVAHEGHAPSLRDADEAPTLHLRCDEFTAVHIH